MPAEHLTPDECDELAEAFRQDAATLPSGSKRESLLKMAEGYRALAALKRMVLREGN